MQLSKYFTLEQLTASNTAAKNGIDNTPDIQRQANLQQLALLLDQIYDAVGPFTITSGYRSPALNALLGNASATSLHMQGMAADILPDNDTVEDYFWKLASNPVSYLAGEIINEVKGEGVVHVSLPYGNGPLTRQLKNLDPARVPKYLMYTDAQLAAEPRYSDPGDTTPVQAFVAQQDDSTADMTADSGDTGDDTSVTPGFSVASDAVTTNTSMMPMLVVALLLGGLAFVIMQRRSAQ